MPSNSGAKSQDLESNPQPPKYDVIVVDIHDGRLSNITTTFKQP